ncbi:hypothetical protein [Archaeoglobus veneficus]|uniref:Viral A-type inclusion protein repeat protein n=1 Tax=Archaeoglobus veneficus (strain DSM 11195 / SNP6) TaxID=693661 RepID=F2KR35_ARCVS|nr:hypothetical protein [Archaeoglobus veneficus]AEA46672.1 Viral A-type inclusion protein repeat protein [Archaeoglobus veneficus SNP6]
MSFGISVTMKTLQDLDKIKEKIEEDTGMKNLSYNRAIQHMIEALRPLDRIKEDIEKEIGVRLSYDKVIQYLIKQYEKARKTI